MRHTVWGAAITLALGMVFSPLSYAATTPDPQEEAVGTSGATMQHVELNAVSESGPAIQSDIDRAPVPAADVNANVGSDLSAPAGPQIIGQVAGPVMAGSAAPKAAMEVPATGAVSQIDPNNHQSFVTAPMTSSIPSALSFFLVLMLCLGAGVSAAVVISLITGKKIALGLAGR